MAFFLSFILYVFVMTSVSPVISNADNWSVIPAERICKPGPPLKATTGKMNCLVIGDSISIGYTPWVARMLGDDFQVQHAPWDVTDGGALDSKYGLQCLHLFLQTAMLEPTRYDVIIFNFGMHDINYGRWPEEYTTPVDYAKNLNAITSMLLSTGAKVGYVLTTPVPWNVTLNDRVKQYNSIASHVMKEYPTVATADLYTWVIEVCGDPPYESCIIARKQPSPHYTPQGYQYLSERVKDLILDLTQDLDENPRSRKRQELLWIASQNRVPCKNKTGKVVTMCPYNSTCCDDLFSVTGQGCCLTPEAIPCGDGKHCCPAGYECDPDCSIHECSCHIGTRLSS
ncbi:hypothetical protein ACROYT_G006167 [Oculina patagonica]